MMNLDEQISILISDAPSDGSTPQLVEAIAPALKQLATQLRHPQYYILQGLNQGWLTTTLSNRAQPGLEKNVIYAFPTLKDAKDSISVPGSPEIIVTMVLVTHILFQFLALEQVDSLVFFETPGQITAGTEVRRQDLQNLIQSQLQQLLSPPPSQFTYLPPNLA